LLATRPKEIPEAEAQEDQRNGYGEKPACHATSYLKSFSNTVFKLPTQWV
jgi:hypothetical protein